MKRIKDKTWNTIDCARALSSDNPEGYKFAMDSARLEEYNKGERSKEELFMS
jgi:hypothetical protein